MSTQLFNRQSIRLRGYDYSKPGWYYITINLQNSSYFLAGIKNGISILTPTGKIADAYWREIPRHYPQVVIDEYIIMVMPEFLGKGIPLFKGANKKNGLKLIGAKTHGEVVELHYKNK